jgi:thiosulfate/3-mercaptopyruvate sulfurtransferase
METLVTTQWLADELGADDLVVLDCTVFLKPGDNGFVAEPGMANFEAGHIPGAAFADLTGALVDTTAGIGFAMPTPEHFGAAMEQLGVKDGSRVVLYDDNNAMWGARVWFMLRWIGFDDAALLDGGLKAWKAEERPLQTGPAIVEIASPGALSLDPRPRLVADKDEVMAAINDGATCLIDALPAPVFSGEMQPYARPGHIPGAINVPGTAMLDPETGRFKPAEEIRAMLPDRPEARTVAY